MPPKQEVNQNKNKIKHLNQSGFLRGVFLVALVSLFLFAAFNSVKSKESHAAAESYQIKSGIEGLCLDDRGNGLASGNQVDAWSCNDSAAQIWSIDGLNIKHTNNYCLSVETTGSNYFADLDNCNGSSKQVWLRDKQGYYSPYSQLCLSVPNSQATKKLTLEACSNPVINNQIWVPTNLSSKDSFVKCTSGNEGQKVACFAAKEWTTWQSGTPSHEALLNSYTDGAPYEEWCADFVSYVYKEAGYPFTGGETDGWDENIAANIQNMGFTMHSPTNYLPKPGDVAFFSYEQGHVEIVVSGGKTPTLVYGNTGTVDLSTGNGNMAANTLTSYRGEGQLVFYLSPN